MRIVNTILCLFLMISCTNQISATGVEFHDANGIGYHSKDAGAVIKDDYDLNSPPRIVIVAIENSTIPEYEQQLNNIYEVDAEQYEYILVVADTEVAHKSGYYTETAVAQKILDDELFTVAIYGINGEVVVSSNEVIDSDSLIQYLTGD